MTIEWTSDFDLPDVDDLGTDTTHDLSAYNSLARYDVPSAAENWAEWLEPETCDDEAESRWLEWLE